ncbi:MAG: DNA-methyltransferase [Anaerolineaceae bacterium]
MICKIVDDDCVEFLKKNNDYRFDLTFLDPPFNQSKTYRSHNDKMSPEKYWEWMTEVCALVHNSSVEGAAIYFMQREKNTHHVMKALEEAGWNYKNLIIWKKKTSAVPSNKRFGMHYQIIVFATKGVTPRVFNKLRIDPPLLETEKYRRPNGMFVTDVWDDIRELTSGYFAGDEPIRDLTGERVHEQQSPVHLLARIILSSTKPEDLVFDPFAGTGTTLTVAKQLMRNSIGTEIDTINRDVIQERVSRLRESDDIRKLTNYYRFTENLRAIWPSALEGQQQVK